MVRDIFKKEPNRSMNPDEVRGTAFVLLPCTAAACAAAASTAAPLP
jgi:hypothetical protein